MTQIGQWSSPNITETTLLFHCMSMILQEEMRSPSRTPQSSNEAQLQPFTLCLAYRLCDGGLKIILITTSTVTALCQWLLSDHFMCNNVYLIVQLTSNMHRVLSMWKRWKNGPTRWQTNRNCSSVFTTGFSLSRMKLRYIKSNCQWPCIA